jgi:hypothetical protein
MSELEKHIAYAAGAADRLSHGYATDEAVCQRCGCPGNQQCGHEPLGLPEHACELRVNDIGGDDCCCWCCATAGLINNTDGGQL